MAAALSRIFPHATYNARNLGITPLAITGGTSLALYGLASTKLTDDQKIQAAKLWTAFQKALIDPKHVTDQDLLDTTLQSMISAENVVLSSPVFYGLYQLIHDSGLPFKHHILQSLIRGLSGTAATGCITAAFYVTAAAVIPWLQEKNEANGMSKKEALLTAQTTAFVAAGPIEGLLEGTGAGLKVTQMMNPGLAVLATVLLTGRLATGALTQFKATGEKDSNDTFNKARSFTITALGTTFFQHGINGVMQTLNKGHGWQGLGKYFTRGNTSGIGSSIDSAGQFAKTFGLRVVYSALWNSLSYREQAPRAWASVTADVPSKT